VLLGQLNYLSQQILNLGNFDQPYFQSKQHWRLGNSVMKKNQLQHNKPLGSLNRLNTPTQRYMVVVVTIQSNIP